MDFNLSSRYLFYNKLIVFCIKQIYNIYLVEKK